MGTAGAPGPIGEARAGPARSDGSSDRSPDRGVGAWGLLLASLSLSAGHGLFLVFALTRVSLVPSRRDLGGGITALLVLYFVATVPLAAGALLLRRRLLALPEARIRLLGCAAALATALAFAAYLVRIRS